jgi:hypothetical protein
MSARPLEATLTEFIDRVRANRLALRMLADWRRRILVEATDSGERYLLVSTGKGIDPLSLPDPAGEADIHVRAPAAILVEIFRGERNPMTEYLAGTLQFHGTTADEMRLDAVVAEIWADVS